MTNHVGAAARWHIAATKRPADQEPATQALDPPASSSVRSLWQLRPRRSHTRERSLRSVIRENNGRVPPFYLLPFLEAAREKAGDSTAA